MSLEDGKVKKVEYSSLGQAMAKGDFTYIYNEVTEWAEKQDSNFNGLFEQTMTNYGDVGIGMVVDALLFAVPKYALDEENNLRPDVEKVVELFISLGADPTLTYYKSMYGERVSNMVLETACLKNSQLLKFLYEKNFWDEDKELETESGLDPLQFAITDNSPQCVEYLIKERGVSVDKRYFFSNDATPIFFAIGRGNEEVFDKLMELGANIKLLNHNDIPAIDFLEAKQFSFDERFEFKPEEKERLQKFAEKVIQVYETVPEKTKEKKVRRTSF